MATNGRLLRYPVERALEDAALARGLSPAQVFLLLLPVWEVEVRGTTIEAKDYELIDRFLERAIAEAGLSRTGELAAFLCLDTALVDRALRFLVRIGHVVTRDGQFALTQLGLTSLRDEKRYEVRHEDTRKMYFDGFGSRPLSRAYYDPGTVTFLSGEDLGSIDRGWIPKPVAMASLAWFDQSALTQLADRADRDEYNLPFRVENPSAKDARQVFLPVYVVRGTDHQGVIRHAVYSSAASEPDPDLSALCRNTRQVHEALENESAQVVGLHPERIRSWLDRKGFRELRPAQERDGTWYVALPAKAFGAQGSLPLMKVGSFAVLSTGLLTLRCEDEDVRRSALLHRLEAFLTGKDRAAELADWLARVCRQLGLPRTSTGQVRAWATEAGRDTLSARLAALVDA